MIRKWIAVSVMAASLSFSPNGMAYNEQMAAAANEMFKHFNQQMLAKAPCKVKAKDLMAWLKEGKTDFVMVDIRTKAEQSVAGLTHPDALHIPLDQLFRKENLDRLPRDKKIVLICHSGTRASAATAFLRFIGFEKAMLLKGGMKALIQELSAKTAPSVQ